jgi:small-conductance mechanosensitive channel
MTALLHEVAAIPLTTKLLAAVIGVLIIHNAFRFLEHRLLPHFGYGGERYRVRKLVGLAAYLVVFAFVTLLFEDRIRQFGFAMGLLGAGVVVALQDMIASVAGWFVISFNNLFRVGDRIQVDQTKGDVVDISALRTTILETGNWVSGDLFNGRIVRIPNSLVLRSMTFNYSQGFRFVWDQVTVKFDSASDHLMARTMLLQIATETVSDYLVEARKSWQKLAENYRVEDPLLTPTVALIGTGGSLEFSLNYIVDYTKRTVVKDQLYTKIVDAVASSDGRLKWASSSTTLKLDPDAQTVKQIEALAALRLRNCGKDQ